MKHWKFGFVLMLSVLIALCLAGCRIADSDGGKDRDKTKDAAADQKSDSLVCLMRGQEKDMYFCDNKITYLPGKITAAGVNRDSTAVAYVIDDLLYLNMGGKVEKVEDCTSILAVSQFGNAVAYFNDVNEVKLYNSKNGKITAYSVPCGASEMDEFELSPDGTAFVYMDHSAAEVILCRNGEQIALENLNGMIGIDGISPNGDLVYIRDHHTGAVYCYKPNGEKTQIWEIDVDSSACGVYYYNYDKTQVLSQQDDMTFISVDGKVPVAFYDTLVEPLDDDCKDFNGGLFTKDNGEVIRISLEASENCVLLPDDAVDGNSAYLHRDGKHIIYRNEEMEWCYISAKANDGAEKNSKMIFAAGENHRIAYVYAAYNLSYAYYVAYNENSDCALYYADGESVKLVSIMSEDAAWGHMVHLTDEGKGIYYCDGEALYYYDGSTTLLVDDVCYDLSEHTYRLLKRNPCAENDYSEFDYYLIRDGHELEKLPTIYDIW